MANARPALRLPGVILTFLLLLPLCSRTYSQASEARKKYWVYFADKDGSLPSPSELPYLTPRALHRRSKVLPAGQLIDAQDLPVPGRFLQSVREAGGELAQESRWLNAASFYLTPTQVFSVSHFPFVRRVEPVVVFRGPRPEYHELGGGVPPPARAASIDYGSSLTQLEVIDVPPLHDLGITGAGVLVGMLDSGFRWKVHEALRTRRVIAEHDFIFNDDNTADQPEDDPAEDVHGTLTMSVLGGYMPGRLIGAAFDADFILGKTEDIRSETRIEEDNWAAALEWMEGQGVDVVSSSLGYNIFDDGTGYMWANGDFNGRTSVTAKAAVRAARLGVLVCDAMGNERNGDGVTGTMLTPADADSIVSVGAVTFTGVLASFSSTGPTNDGRTKPDMVAPGVGVYCAHVPDSYWLQQGTSLATPLAAGSAALVLSARPELSPIQVRDALRSTARTLVDTGRFPASPNNFTGWGLVSALNAALSFGPVFSNPPAITAGDSVTVVSSIVVSKFGIVQGSVSLHYSSALDPVSSEPGPARGGLDLRRSEAGRAYSSIVMTLDSAMLYPTSGRYRATIPHQLRGTLVQFYVEASDSAGNTYESPAPSTGTVWHLRYGLPGATGAPVTPRSPSLVQNYPNPFNGETIIEFDLSSAEFIDLRVYDVTGRQVALLAGGYQQAGYAHTVVFDGRNLASGTYFYRLKTPGLVSTRKMMLIR